jgi:hypothetical protein
VVEQVEREFAANLGPGDFDRLRELLLRLANGVDPIGAFGVGDEEPTVRRRSAPARRPRPSARRD